METAQRILSSLNSSKHRCFSETEMGLSRLSPVQHQQLGSSLTSMETANSMWLTPVDCQQRSGMAMAHLLARSIFSHRGSILPYGGTRKLSRMVSPAPRYSP